MLYKSTLPLLFPLQDNGLQSTFLGLPREGFSFGTDTAGVTLTALSTETFVLRRSEILQTHSNSSSYREQSQCSPTIRMMAHSTVSVHCPQVHTDLKQKFFSFLLLSAINFKTMLSKFLFGQPATNIKLLHLLKMTASTNNSWQQPRRRINILAWQLIIFFNQLRSRFWVQLMNQLLIFSHF